MIPTSNTRGIVIESSRKLLLFLPAKSLQPRGSKIQSSRQDSGHFPAKYLPIYRLLKSWNVLRNQYISTGKDGILLHLTSSRAVRTIHHRIVRGHQHHHHRFCSHRSHYFISTPPTSSSYHRRAVNKIIISNHASRTQEAPQAPQCAPSLESPQDGRCVGPQALRRPSQAT